MDETLKLLRLLDAAETWTDLAGSLHLAQPLVGAATASVPAQADRTEMAWLAREGLVTLASVAVPETCAAMVATIGTVIRAGYPATFVYAFDEAWALGEHIRARVSAAVGRDYRLVADAWAWEIPPGRGRGWPPHRGVPGLELDRDAPEVVNTWVALSDVTPERSCLSFVPLDEDPGYPGAMTRVDAPLENARALPVAAGTALAWNANVLHWGGPCSARAPGPRVSCSFTLCRDDFTPDFAPVLAVVPLDLRARIELIAEQICTYGEGQPDVSAAVLAWARTLSGIRKARP